jgi:uncharacterized cupredoxin-like copper-binding protein
MKNRSYAFPVLSALIAPWLVTAALAGGTHGGGHGTASIGEPGKAAQVSRTIEVQMLDTMRYTPADFTVKQGETIRFVVTNVGKLKHEFVLGTDKDLKEHYEVMKKFPEMEHSDPNMVSLEPGKTGEVIWKFSKSGSVSIACLHPGHYDAGMKGKVTVASSKGAKKPASDANSKAHQH